MSRSIFTFNRYHLGDNLIFLHLLRALAKQHDQTPFVHFCNGCDLHQLHEVVADLPNIILANFESPLWEERGRIEAIDTWKNHDRFWENSRFRWDWSQFMLSHHDWTAARMGFISPFKVREHLLFDYPALEQKGSLLYDFLIVTSEPSSGQFSPMAQHGSGYLDKLVGALNEAGKSVWVTSPSPFTKFGPDQGGWKEQTGPSCTRDCEMTITGVGRISQMCQHIIGVATGPLWPCINVHNNHSHEGRKFIALLDNNESINMPHWKQTNCVENVFEMAKEEKWI